MTSTTTSPSLKRGVLHINSDDVVRIAETLATDPNLQDNPSVCTKCLPTTVSDVLPSVQPVDGINRATVHVSI